MSSDDISIFEANMMNNYLRKDSPTNSSNYDFAHMESVMNVFELLSGCDEPALRDLVTPHRQLVRDFDLFTSAVQDSGANADNKVFQRLFLFRDVIVIAKYISQSDGGHDGRGISRKMSHMSDNSSTQIDNNASTGGGIWRMFSFRKTPTKKQSMSTPRASGRQSGVGANDSSATQGKGKRGGNGDGKHDDTTFSYEMNDFASRVGDEIGDLKFSHYFPLVQCSFLKLEELDKDGMAGIHLTFVENVRTSTSSFDNGSRIDQILLWFESVIARDMFISTISELNPGSILSAHRGERRNALPKLDGYKSIVNKEQPPNGGSTAATTTAAQPKQQMPLSPVSGRPSVSESVKPKPLRDVQSLKDLEDFYQVSFQTMVDAPSDSKTQLSIEFPDGPMGISLGSGEGVGVIIIKVAADRFAELAGVCVGDRLTSVGDTVFDTETTWQDALACIKSKERPLIMRFERSMDICAKIEEAMMNEEVERDPTSRMRWNNKKEARNKSLKALNILESMTRRALAEEERLEIGHQKVMAICKNLYSKASSEEERKCINVIKELLVTEKDYVNGLSTTVKQFILPLRKATTRMSCKDDHESGKICEHGVLRSSCTREMKMYHISCKAEDIRDIFMNTEVLLKVNSELLFTLNEGVIESSMKYPGMTVTEVIEALVPSFVKVLPFLAMYAHYCHQYPHATSKLLQIRTAKDVDEFLSQRESLAVVTMKSDANAKMVSLASLLIKPVQRICKYPLLFNELLKSVKSMTERWEQDGQTLKRMSKNLGTVLERLEEATNQVQKIADNVNHRVHIQEALHSVAEIYEELGGGKDTSLSDLFVPYRRYLGSYDVHVRQNFDVQHERVFHKLYLFNDYILLATPKAKRSGSFVSRRLSIGKERTSNMGVSTDARSAASPRDPQKYVKVCGLDLGNCEIKKIHEKEKDQEWYGFLVKTTDRKHIADKATGSSKIATVIQKYEVFLQKEDECNELLKKIKENLETLDHQKEEDEVRKERLSGMEVYKKRMWKKKSNGNLANRTSSFHDEDEVVQDPQAKLSELAHHYEVVLGQTENQQQQQQ